LSVRLKLTLSYAGFLMLAGAVLLVAGYFSLSRGVHPGVIFLVRSHADLLRGFAPTAAIVMAFLLVFGLLGGWLLAGIVTAGPASAHADLVASTPADGARLITRAWVDPEFKTRLLGDARAAALELGLDPGPSPVVMAVENTEAVHHMVVCTLCSCYPRALLGPPPDWYKSLPYRSRAVSDPRGVLTEFGVELADDVEVRVLDSTADIRYLVIPLRPPGSEEMNEQQLAALVTRDAMIGVAQPTAPTPASAE
jgi:nitrile hydratase